MSLAVTFATQVTVSETPTTGVPAIDSNQAIRQSQYNTSKSLTDSTTPNTKKTAKQVYTLSSGTASIDLTSLTGLNGAALSLSGSKVRILKASCPSGNGAAITIAKGVTNGYTGLGSAFSCTIPPGGEVTFYDGGNGVAVSGSVKIFDVTGTGSTDTVRVEVVAGD